MSKGDPGRSSVTVRIAGEEHTIRSTAGEEYTRRCAKLVDERVGEIRKRAGLLEPHKVAILAALSITDELLQARDQLDEVGTGVKARAEKLLETLEAAL